MSRPDVGTGVSAERLRADVEALAADTLAGRATPSPGLEGAAAILARRFGRLKLQPVDGTDDFRQTFECGDPGSGANVLGIVPGREPSAGVVLVSAHYDHIGSDPRLDDPVFNGANDNASGVAGMLAIAEIVASLDPPPVRSVVFAAFCGEEIGLRGSTHFVEDPPVPLSRIVAVVNLEMLGRPTLAHPRRIWITGEPLSDIRRVFVAANADAEVELVSAEEVGPLEGEAFDRSDNYPFARRGVVAHAFSTGRIDRYYHAADDEPDSLDYPAMAVIVGALARGVVALADGAAAPRWTDAGRAAGYGNR